MSGNYVDTGASLFLKGTGGEADGDAGRDGDRGRGGEERGGACHGTEDEYRAASTGDGDGSDLAEPDYGYLAADDGGDGHEIGNNGVAEDTGSDFAEPDCGYMTADDGGDGYEPGNDGAVAEDTISDFAEPDYGYLAIDDGGDGHEIGNNGVVAEDTGSGFAEPDYGYMAADDDGDGHEIGNNGVAEDTGSDFAEPDYGYLAADDGGDGHETGNNGVVAEDTVSDFAEPDYGYMAIDDGGDGHEIGNNGVAEDTGSDLAEMDYGYLATDDGGDGHETGNNGVAEESESAEMEYGYMAADDDGDGHEIGNNGVVAEDTGSDFAEPDYGYLAIDDGGDGHEIGHNGVVAEDTGSDLAEPDYGYLAADDGGDGHETGSNGVVAEDIGSDFAEPDYGYLAAKDVSDGHEIGNGSDVDQSVDSNESTPSSPDYDRLGLTCDEECGAIGNGSQQLMDTRGKVGEDEYYYTEAGRDEMDSEEYILGTLMVRVLQATHLKSNPHNRGGGGIVGLLTNHRLVRQQRHTMSPASGGHLTPSSLYAQQHQQLYAKLSYGEQRHSTPDAMEPHANGDYHWSRGDQSYFDVTCPASPLWTGEEGMPCPPPPASSTARPSPAPAARPKKHASGETLNGSPQQQQKQSTASNGRPSPPILRLALYSKNNVSGITSRKQPKPNPFDDPLKKDNSDDYLVGTCSINILRILSGMTPYFDEWCPLHQDTGNNNDRVRRPKRDGEESSGRVRIVIEYEPTDPPPRPGDKCVFANVYPHLMDELYPIPLYSVQNNTIRSVRSSTVTSTMSPTPSSATASLRQHSPLSPSPTIRPKSYCVEEAVGDHIVLSYDTPREKWHCTFEVHRYLLLCVERHQALVEKYRERVLDLCDNIYQSPAVVAVARTVEAIPEEGLVYVSADAVGGGVGLVGRWWDTGVEGLVEDVVDGINLDGRYTRLSGGEEEELGEERHNQKEGAHPLASAPDDGTSLPGMPCCPITSVAMIEPVVAADGHTYERHAIARWLRTSNRSPLTGEVLAHANLVPNYLLLSSLGNEVALVAEPGED